MNAKEFNTLFITLGKEKLTNLSFKQSGNKFYRIDNNKLICFIKGSSRGDFTGIYLAIKFLANSDKRKIFSYLENYDHSIKMENLKQEMIEFNSPLNFKYDLQFYSREVGLIRRNPYNFTTYLDLIKWNEVQKDINKAEQYVQQSLDILVNEGLKFIELMNPETSFKILMKNKGLDNQMKNIIKLDYNKLIDINQNEKKVSWIKRLFK